MSPKLKELIEKAKARGPMTAEERAEQRRSWVRGELMLEHPEMTFEEADRRVRDAENEVYGERRSTNG